MEARLEAIEVKAKVNMWTSILREDKMKVLADRSSWNFVDEIYIEGVLCVGPSQVMVGIFGYFKEHFTNTCVDRPRIEGIEFVQISTKSKSSLEENFNIKEMKEALDGCDGNKAPGPDGFNMNFIKKRWKDIEGDFMSFLNDFSMYGSEVSCLNHTFITLIPMVANPSSISDYRPISLVNSLYKVLAKILSNWLRKVMDEA
ncbi:hypothetical protein Dsin_012895 [Dipteronia sinensis]|uniref:Uncharacterized protein n=1 Tax=Dipteronia sinensis TaxID=43782 RepID=A0AAE0AJR8_9ROSI|nr:hypothetical protein Dsin_012895 [Dipteronia sinensis]